MSKISDFLARKTSLGDKDPIFLPPTQEAARRRAHLKVRSRRPAARASARKTKRCAVW